jgi:hypothetical protein
LRWSISCDPYRNALTIHAPRARRAGETALASGWVREPCYLGRPEISRSLSADLRQVNFGPHSAFLRATSRKDIRGLRAVAGPGLGGVEALAEGEGRGESGIGGARCGCGENAEERRETIAPRLERQEGSGLGHAARDRPSAGRGAETLRNRSGCPRGNRLRDGSAARRPGRSGRRE